MRLPQTFQVLLFYSLGIKKNKPFWPLKSIHPFLGGSYNKCQLQLFFHTVWMWAEATGMRKEQRIQTCRVQWEALIQTHHQKLDFSTVFARQWVYSYCLLCFSFKEAIERHFLPFTSTDFPQVMGKGGNVTMLLEAITIFSSGLNCKCPVPFSENKNI